MTDSQNTRQFVGFQVDGQSYAFPIEKVQEIVILDDATKTPQVARCVEGVSNLRGSIIPIINLRKLLELPTKPTDAETRTIVVNVGERTVGCTVDAVSQVIRIAEDTIQPVPEALSADGNRDIAGFAKQNDQLVILLDVEQLLSPDRFQ
ncbi:MAG: chemotaxis protein CheW [Planctomycetota bacterium]